MTKTRTDFVPPEEMTVLSIQQMIAKGAMTHEIYESKTPEEQALIRGVLFDMYGRRLNLTRALSSIEFLLIAVAKLLTKVASGEELTVDEKASVARLKQMMARHPLPLVGNSWEYDYIEEVLSATISNREEYAMKKVQIAGFY